MIQTTDGKLITGVIANQSATSVTLRRKKGEEDTVLRSNISELRELTVSAMPDNLEGGVHHERVGGFARISEKSGKHKRCSGAEVYKLALPAI